MKLVEDGAVAVGTSFSGENADSPYEDAVADTSASHQPRDHGVKGLGIPSLLGHCPFLVASFPSYCSGTGYCSPWSHDLEARPSSRGTVCTSCPVDSLDTRVCESMDDTEGTQACPSGEEKDRQVVPSPYLHRQEVTQCWVCSQVAILDCPGTKGRKEKKLFEQLGCLLNQHWWSVYQELTQHLAR